MGASFSVTRLERAPLQRCTYRGPLLPPSVPVVQSATEDGYSPPDVLAMLDESARSMPYGGWLEQQRQKRPGRFFENAVW